MISHTVVGKHCSSRQQAGAENRIVCLEVKETTQEKKKKKRTVRVKASKLACVQPCCWDFVGFSSTWVAIYDLSLCQYSRLWNVLQQETRRRQRIPPQARKKMRLCRMPDETFPNTPSALPLPSLSKEGLIYVDGRAVGPDTRTDRQPRLRLLGWASLQVGMIVHGCHRAEATPLKIIMINQ